MKAGHRHQLQTNVLADRLGRLLQGMKSSPTSTSVLVWVFIVLAVGTFAVWQYSANATQTERSDLWVQLDKAAHDPEKGPGELTQIALQQKGTIPGRTASFEIARMKFQAGQGNLSSTFYRTEAIKNLREARELYIELAGLCPDAPPNKKPPGQCADAPELAQEALMAIAKIDESLIGIGIAASDTDNPEDDLHRASKAYRYLAEKFPASDLGRAGAARAKELQENDSAVVTFYRELSELAAPKTKSDPGKGLLPELPPLPGTLKADTKGK